jgi:hypothetical protein
MIAKKFTKTDIENKSLIFRQIGAIIVLSLVFLAFEYKTDEINSMNDVQKWFNNSPVDNDSYDNKNASGTSGTNS